MVAAWNWVDWLIVAVVGLSAVVSLMRGLVVEVFSLLIAVCAALMSFYFALPLADAMLTGCRCGSLASSSARKSMKARARGGSSCLEV